MKQVMRLIAIVMILIGMPSVIWAQPSSSVLYDFDIGIGPLSRALSEVSEQSQTPILARSEHLEGYFITRISERLSLDAALAHLLENTDLTFDRVDGAYVIRRKVQAEGEAFRSTTLPSEPVEQSVEGLQEAPIIVTGYRLANAQAIRDKYQAETIEDGINQDTITHLPDLTVSMVARRIVGVASIPESGIETNRKIQSGQSVLIRGLDANYSRTTIDGLPFAVADERERAANLSLFPPTAIRRIEAHKTLTADMDPHGLTGRLNLETRRVLDSDQPDNSLRLSVGEESTRGAFIDDQGYNLRLNGVHAHRFNDDLGVLLAGSYERFFSTSFDERPGADPDTYRFYSPADEGSEQVDFFAQSDGFPVPRRNQVYIFENEQKRASALGKVEWRPSDRTRFDLLAGYFWQDEYEVRYEHLVLSLDPALPLERSATQGQWADGLVEYGFVSQPETTQTLLIGTHLHHDWGPHRHLEISGAYSHSQVDVTRLMSKFGRGHDPEGGSAPVAFSYQLQPDGVQLDIDNPALNNDPSQIEARYIRDRSQDIEHSLGYLNTRIHNGLAVDELGYGWEWGLALTQKDQRFDRDYIEGDVFARAGCVEAELTQCPYVRMDGFVEDQQFSTTDPEVDFWLIDDARLRQVWMDQGQPLTVDRTGNSINTDYSLKETYLGGWVRQAFKGDRWRVEAGLRYDATQTDVDYFRRDERLSGPDNKDQYVPATRAYRYDYWLPSLHGSWEARPNVLVRGAYTRTLGRPNIMDLTRADTISVPDAGQINISRGNPDLKPLISDNFDLSFEYYFNDRNSLLSLAFFHKDVQDLIFLQNQIQPDYEFEGVLYTAHITQPVNTSEAKLYGVEAALRLDFESAQNVLIQPIVLDMNITWTGSEFTYFDAQGVPRSPGGWVNQPEFIFNVQLSYEHEKFGGLLAYNFVDEYLSNILAESGDLYDTFAQARGVFDLQLRVQARPGVTLLGEVQNLTDEDLVFNRRYAFGDLLSARAQRGRAVWLGLNWSF